MNIRTFMKMDKRCNRSVYQKKSGKNYHWQSGSITLLQHKGSINKNKSIVNIFISGIFSTIWAMIIVIYTFSNEPLFAIYGVSGSKLTVSTADTVPAGTLEYEPLLALDWGLGNNNIRSSEFANRVTWGVAKNFEMGLNADLLQGGAQELALGLKWFFLPTGKSQGFAFQAGLILPAQSNEVPGYQGGSENIATGSVATTWDGGLIFSTPFSSKVSLDISSDFYFDQLKSTLSNYSLSSIVGLGWYFVDSVQMCLELEHVYNFSTKTQSLTGYAGITWNLNENVTLVFGQGVNFWNSNKVIETNSFFASTIVFNPAPPPPVALPSQEPGYKFRSFHYPFVMK